MSTATATLSVAGSLLEVPTLGGWGALLLVAILAGLAAAAGRLSRSRDRLSIAK